MKHGQAAAPAVFHDQREDLSVYRRAGLVMRWYALALDVSFSTPIDVLVHMPFNRSLARLHAYGHDHLYMVLSVFLAVTPIFLYFVVPTALDGRTLGKRIVGLRVIRVDGGESLGLAQALLREVIGKSLSAGMLGLGFLMAAVAPRRQALHDRLARTIVVAYRDLP